MIEQTAEQKAAELADKVANIIFKGTNASSATCMRLSEDVRRELNLIKLVKAERELEWVTEDRKALKKEVRRLKRQHRYVADANTRE